ncbi:MAG TPA: TonB-dependent receptor [Blastocatellia bacterium]|nr:TonB-dependent receptor [Blastocatellia bacterium]
MKTRFTLSVICLFLVMLLSFLFSPLSLAQATSGTVLGTVRDDTGAVISGATVTLKHIATGLTRSITTDEDGRYRVLALPLGSYEVKVERAGFNAEVRSGIELTVGREAVVDFALRVGKIEDTVTITGEAPLVETTNPALASLVAERNIRELPLNGRDVFQLTTLQVGVTNTAGITTSFGGGAIDTGPGTTKIAVNGARITANNFLLDGTTVNDAFNNTPGSISGGFTGVDMVREFQILTNSYSAEYGGAGGAIINVVSKSGTNDFHGTAFEFHRNDNLDARNFFDPSDVPEFKRNQFGGSLGGPIIENKTFFFTGYEGLRENLGVSRRFAVPTLATRARAVPSVRPYVDLYPLPNGEDLGNGTAFFIRSASDRTRDDSFTARIDHELSSKDSLFGRYTFDDSIVEQASEVIQNNVNSGRNQYVTISEDHLFSPRFLNTFRIGFNRSRILGDKPYLVDIPPELEFVPGQSLGTFFGISEIASLGTNLFNPRTFAFNHFEVADQVAITRGSHAIKAGFSARRIQLNASSNLILAGVYVYFGLPPNPLFPNGLSTLDTFLLGLPAAFQAPAPGSDFYRAIRQSIFGSFIQDDWKISPRLTLNLGLRYEFFTTPTEKNGKVANLRHVTDPSTTVGEPFFDNPSEKNFAPRIGFAYDVFGNGRTSVRGGYGIFDILILPFNYRFEMSGQPPFASLSLVIGPPPAFFPAPFPNAYDVITSSAVPQPLSVNSFDFDPKRSYMQQYNLSVQHEVVPTFVVTAAYAGSRGVHLARKNDLNIRTDFIIRDGRKFFPPLPPDVDVASRRLNPNFAAIRHIFFDANSNYHALQLRADKRFGRGLDFQASYTWSKSIDDSSGTEAEFANQPPGARLQDPLDTRAERGLSAFDIRHNFVLSATYEFPVNNSLEGATDKLLNGWQVTGILNARSGFPFSLVLGFDRANDGSVDNVAQRPDVVPGRSYESAVTGRPERYVDPTAFDLPAAGTYGNSGRNVLIGPGLATFDLGLFKNTTFGEKLRVQFRAEAFNLFNRANFALPENLVIFTSEQKDIPGNFARITSTATTSRQVQLGLKFIF